MFLVVKDLEVCHGKAPALRGISLEVPEKSIVTVIGPNGSGKTTLMYTITGLKRPLSGEISFKGTRIEGMPPYHIVKLGIALVPEGRRLFPYMTVLENLEMGAYVRKNRKDTIKMMEEIYKSFPVIKNRKRQLAGTLSGGEQQMLAIARALLAGPQLMLLDEPSLGLAPLMVSEVMRIIKEIHERGVSILLIEQNARLALNLAQLGYILETGQILLKAETKDLLQNDFVKRAYLGL
jgi:branched-chain amino acid transport system ATP-binding protein